MLLGALSTIVCGLDALLVIGLPGIVSRNRGDDASDVSMASTGGGTSIDWASHESKLFCPGGYGPASRSVCGPLWADLNDLELLIDKSRVLDEMGRMAWEIEVRIELMVLLLELGRLSRAATVFEYGTALTRISISGDLKPSSRECIEVDVSARPAVRPAK